MRWLRYDLQVISTTFHGFDLVLTTYTCHPECNLNEIKTRDSSRAPTEPNVVNDRFYSILIQKMFGYIVTEHLSFVIFQWAFRYLLNFLASLGTHIPFFEIHDPILQSWSWTAIIELAAFRYTYVLVHISIIVLWCIIPQQEVLCRQARKGIMTIRESRCQPCLTQ